MWLSLAAVVLVFALVMQSTHPLTMLAPLLLFTAMMTLGAVAAHRLRRLNQRVMQAQQLTMMRDHQAALRLAWETMPTAVHQPQSHSALTAILAAALDQVKAHEAAIVAYDELLDRLPAEHPGSVFLKVQRAISLLQCDRLLDADNALRSLRGVADAVQQSVTRAVYRLAVLLQQVRTNHFTDALEAAPTLLDDLRPLGIEAGYGHALMALSFSQAPEGDAARSQEWWSRATLLVEPAALIQRFAELQPLTSGGGNGADDTQELAYEPE